MMVLREGIQMVPWGQRSLITWIWDHVLDTWIKPFPYSLSHILLPQGLCREDSWCPKEMPGPRERLKSWPHFWLYISMPDSKYNVFSSNKEPLMEQGYLNRSPSPQLAPSTWFYLLPFSETSWWSDGHPKWGGWLPIGSELMTFQTNCPHDSCPMH